MSNLFQIGYIASLHEGEEAFVFNPNQGTSKGVMASQRSDAYRFSNFVQIGLTGSRGPE